MIHLIYPQFIVTNLSLIQLSYNKNAFQLTESNHSDPPPSLKKLSTLAEPTTESQIPSAIEKLKRARGNCQRKFKRQSSHVSELCASLNCNQDEMSDETNELKHCMAQCSTTPHSD